MGTDPQLFLFIGGSPRSGTSALTHVINANRYAAVGMERYAPIWNRETLRPEHFEAGYFLTEHSFDAGRNLAMKFGRQGIAERFPTAKVVGDKYPYVTNHLEFIFRTFPKAKVMFILRDPVFVCESQQVRFDNPDDVFDIDAENGLKRWNKALNDVKQVIEDGKDVSVVTYEKAFQSLSSVARIYESVGLAIEDADQKRLASLLKTAADLAQKERQTSEAIRQLVSQQADFGLYRELTMLHCILRDQDG
jgi:hypothetical protein